MDWTPVLFALGILTYLTFGFFYGIFREWSYQTIALGGQNYSRFRIAIGFINFSYLVFVNQDANHVRWAIIGSVNGINYWLVNAILWPLFVVGSSVQIIFVTFVILMIALIVLIGFAAEFMSTWPAKKLSGVETYLKKQFDITTVSY